MPAVLAGRGTSLAAIAIPQPPIDGRHFLRFCYAGSAAEMREAVERIGNWLDR